MAKTAIGAARSAMQLLVPRVDAFEERTCDSFDNSLWSQTGSPPLSLPVLRERRSAEVVIVGAGYTGLATALALLERSVSVVVIDAHEPGFGASGRNGGQVIPAFKHEPHALIASLGEDLGRNVIDLVTRSADSVFSLIARHRIDCDAVRSGWLQVTETAAGAETLRRRCDAWRDWGADGRLVDREETVHLTGSEHYRTSWLLAGAGSVHPLKYVRGLARAALSLGASIYAESPALRLEAAGEGWRVVTPEGELHAKRVVLATNAYTTDLWRGLRQSVVPLYSMQIATDPLPAQVGATILRGGQTAADARHLVHYFRRDALGRFLIGARGPFTNNPSAGHARRLVATATCIYPQLRDVPFPIRWAGRVAMTPDHMPHLHRLAPGLTAMLGYNGRGVALATAIGPILAAACLDTGNGSVAYPASPLRPIPFHRLHRAGVQAMVAYYRLADRA